MKSGSPGFSALEITVVMVLVGVLSALAVKPISGWIKRVRIQNAAEGIKHLVIVARSRAIANPSLHCGVFFDVTTGAQKALLFLDRDNSSTYSASQDSAYLQPYKMKDNIVLSIPAGSFSTLVFRGDGSANQSTTVNLTLGAMVDTINVLASTGRVKSGIK